MAKVMARLWSGLMRFLLQRIVLVLTIMFCVAVGIALTNMSSLSASLIESQAIANAERYVESFSQAVTLYSDTAADRAKVGGLTVTHAYLAQKGAIPLPSTFAIELGDLISDRNVNMSVRFYSDYPFPWRQATGGPKTEFERTALAALRQQPKQKFVQFAKKDGHTTLHYARASIMKASCVTCHNTHLASPKKDWEVGDVGGAWEISQPLDHLVDRVNQDLRETFLMLGGISVLGLSGLTLVMGKQRETAQTLERRVKDRTADLAQANEELGKRNQLIRQVFGRYLNDQVVTKLLESPEGLQLGGNRRQITLLTSDLRGFTALSERLSPEEVLNILNLYLEYMADMINQYEGTIDEFMGDGILVLFGAPHEHEDDALRAVACACAMQLAMGAVNQHIAVMGLPRLEMGIGINTGDVVVGNIGSEKRTKYGVVGSQVNLTYRIESYTRGGQILISESTLKAAGANVRVSSSRQVQVKGMQQPIPIYEVYGVSGRYNLYLPQEEEKFVPVLPPIDLVFALIDGKAVTEMGFSGQLVMLSPKGAEIVVQTRDSLNQLAEFSNLKLNLQTNDRALGEADSYAKIAEVDAGQQMIRIHFTAVPPVVQTYLEQRYQAG